MNDLNFHSIDVEGNIYAMATLEECNTKLALVALRDCQVCCIEYKNDKPNLRKIQFAYLPTGGRILSIQVLRRGPNDFIIAIAHCQFSEFSKQASTKSRTNQIRISESREPTHSQEYYLNLYSSARGGALEAKTIEIETIASCCQTIHLKYSPAFVLPVQFMRMDDHDEPQTDCYGFLVPGGDHKVHAFLDNSLEVEPTSPSYYDLDENSADEAGLDELPSLLDSKPLWVDLIYVCSSSYSQSRPSLERWTCFGMENGSFIIYKGVYSKLTGRFTLACSFSKHFADTIVPSVKFFNINSTYPSRLRNFVKLTECKDRPKGLNSNASPLFSDDAVINLLVINGTGYSIIYEDILKYGLDRGQELPDSQRRDVNVTAAVADINMDGKNEIIIGGYGYELLTYQHDDETGFYYFDSLKLLNDPVYSILTLDFTNNATKNILLLSGTGLLVTQPHVIRALSIAERRFELIQRCFLNPSTINK